jgi:acetylornithine/N-succinyldiaminopimelate aminotransferase
LPPLQDVARSNPNVTAVFLETIQGEGGINASRWDYLQGLRRLCDERGWLLMLDEVQCGIGRTGKWFAHQWAGIQPDVMPLAKGLGSGVPIGAIVAGPKARGCWARATTAPPSAAIRWPCAPVLKRCASWKKTALLANAASVGKALHDGLARELAGLAGVKEIRGAGLMIGIELTRPCGVLLGRAAEAGLDAQRHRRQRDPPGAAADPQP